MCKVSVVMPAYNCERFIKEAVDSVLSQTLTDLELIVVDDCSKDGTYRIVDDIAQSDTRVKLFKMETNSGVAKVRNFGISKATGKYIALLDSDDVWEKDKLERQIALVEKSNADICYCSYAFIDENGNVIKKPFIVPPKTSFKKMLSVNVISCSTGLFKTDLLKSHPFNPDYYHEDYVLWMELLKLPAKAVGDTGVLMHYRQLNTSRSHNKSNAAKHRWKIYREVLKLSFIESTFAFISYALHGVIKYYF